MSQTVSEAASAEPDFFELTLTRFTPGPVTLTVRIQTVAELDEQLRSVVGEELLAVGLCYVAEDADWGSFWLMVRGDRAYIHLMPDQCVTGHDASPGRENVERVLFQDDGRNWHEVAREETVSREVGLRALRYWLQCGEKLPELD